MSNPTKGVQDAPLDPEFVRQLERDRCRAGARVKVRELCDEIKRTLDESEAEIETIFGP